MALFRLLLAALCLGAMPVQAASFYCSAPSEPLIFVGETSRSAMELMKLEVENYLDEVKDYLECLNLHRDEVVAEAESVISEWETAVQFYNARQR